MMGGAFKLHEIRPGLALEEQAAMSWARMEAARGRPLDVNRSTVDRDSQMKLYIAYTSGASSVLALHPDESWHCIPRARAVDTDDDAWIRQHPEHGWRFVVPSERWHAQYYPNLDRHRNEGWPDMALNADTDYEAFKAMLYRALQWDIRDGGKGAGADSKYGATLWDRLGAIQRTAAGAAPAIDYDELARAIVKEIMSK